MSKGKEKESDKPEIPEERVGIMLPEDLEALEAEETAEEHGIVPVPGSDEGEDDLSGSGQFEPSPVRAAAEAQPEKDDPTEDLLRAALEARTTATPAPLPMPAPKHPDAFANVDPTAPTNLPAKERILAALGRSTTVASTPTGFTQEGDEVHKLPVQRPKKPSSNWLRPLGIGMGAGAAGLTIAGGIVGAAYQNGLFDKEEAPIAPIPSLSETIGQDILVAQPIAPELSPEEQELLDALKNSRDGILVVWCGDKPGQLSLNEEGLLYPKGEPEFNWTGVEWAVPWVQIQGFDAFPKALRDYCDEASVGKKTIISLSKPSQE